MRSDKILSILQYEGDVCSYMHREISGSEFEKIFGDKYIFVKLTNTDEEKTYASEDGYGKYRGFGGMDTIFIDEPKGIYFTNLKNAWTQFSSVLCDPPNEKIIGYKRNVTIPKDAKVYVGPNKFRTNKLILYPGKKIDNKIYMKAIIRYQLSLKHIPLESRDTDMCMTSLDGGYSNVQYFPVKILDKNTCLELVGLSEYMLKYIPSNLIDKDICIEAVKSNGSAIYYVPPNILDKDICMIAVKKYGYALDAIPSNMLDKELCMIAVKQYYGDPI